MASLARFWNSEKSVKFFKIWWTRGDSNTRWFTPVLALPTHLVLGDSQAVIMTP
jgi:hypothetical protein